MTQQTPAAINKEAVEATVCFLRIAHDLYKAGATEAYKVAVDAANMTIAPPIYLRSSQDD